MRNVYAGKSSEAIGVDAGRSDLIKDNSWEENKILEWYSILLDGGHRRLNGTESIKLLQKTLGGIQLSLSTKRKK
jgi:hypothetical protein